MGDTSGEIKGLIVAITFLSTFFIIVAMIPAEFMVSSTEGRTVEVPEYFEAIDIQFFSFIHNFTIGAPDIYGKWDYKFEFAGRNVEFFRQEGLGFSVRLYDKFWIFEYNIRGMEWFDANGRKVSEYDTFYLDYLPFDELDSNYDSDMRVCPFTVKRSGETEFKVYFAFNTTKYSTPSEALEDNELHALFCAGIDDANTKLNAWNLVGAILFFQMPDVHPAINALIAIPLWTLIAYIVYVLILKAIPFVGG